MDCDECGGSGDCPWCDGTGNVGPEHKICPDCEGSGDCADCNGTGQKQEHDDALRFLSVER